MVVVLSLLDTINLLHLIGDSARGGPSSQAGRDSPFASWNTIGCCAGFRTWAHGMCQSICAKTWTEFACGSRFRARIYGDSPEYRRLAHQKLKGFCCVLGR